MTVAQLEEEMSEREFEQWMVLQKVRGDECPHCGSPKPQSLEEHVELMHSWMREEITCAVCKEKYPRIRRANPIEE